MLEFTHAQRLKSASAMSHHRSNGSSIHKSRKYSSSYYKHLPENRNESSDLGQSSGSDDDEHKSDDTTESLSELPDSEVAADDSPQPPQHPKPHQSDPNAQQKHGRLSARRTAAHRPSAGPARGVVQRSLETTQETHSASVKTHRSNEGAREATLTKNSRKESRRVVKETWQPSHMKSHGRTISVCSKHPLYKPDKAEKEKKEQYMVVFAPGGRFIRKQAPRVLRLKLATRKGKASTSIYNYNEELKHQIHRLKH
ncbi:Protein of unknown function, partial [Gryllus bimaculatus]